MMGARVAAEALGRSGDPLAVAPLIEALGLNYLCRAKGRSNGYVSQEVLAADCLTRCACRHIARDVGRQSRDRASRGDTGRGGREPPQPGR